MAQGDASAEIAKRRAKYAEMHSAQDDEGRLISVSQLRPSERMKIQAWTPGLNGNDTIVDSDPDSPTYGKTIEVSQRVPLIFAASVREINGAKIGFPKTIEELYATLDRLDQNGLEAVGSALAKFAKKEEEEKVPTEEEAKN